MTGTFKRSGRIFKAEAKENGNVRLSYLGRDDDPFHQFITWLCDDEAEAEEMIEAVIDPERYADDEYRARHREELFKMFKW